MLLKRLSHLLPSDLQQHIPELESAGVKTSENLIYTPRATLLDLVPSISEDELDDVIQGCIHLTSAPMEDGNTVFEKEKGKQRQWAGFGLSELDSLVAEWDGSGIIEICGPRRVGKSLVALRAALWTLASEPDAMCHWLDTEGSFPPDRAKSILEEWGVKDMTPTLSRLIVSPCFRLDPDFHQAINNIQSSLGQENAGESSEQGRIRFLVVDQITSLFKDQLVNTNSAGQAAMISALEYIAEMTYSHHLTTIEITNAHASSVPTNPYSRFSATSIKPALGSAFAFASDVTILMQETGKLFGMMDAGERDRVRTAPGLRTVVEVLKSRVSPAGRWMVIDTDGTSLNAVVPTPTEDEQTIRQSAGLPIGDERPAIGSLAQTLRP